MLPDFFSIIVASVERSPSKGPGGVAGVEDHRQRLDVERDQIGGVFGEILILGEDRRDRLADIAHGVMGKSILPIWL